MPDIHTSIWVALITYGTVLLFSAGGAYFQLRANSRELKDLKTKLSKVSIREERHYRRTVVALTAITAVAGNPHPDPKLAARLVREMADENGRD